LEQLAGSGSVVLVTDRRHLPSGALLPWAAGITSGKRLRQQIALEANGRSGVLWAQIIAVRIGTQALNLRHLGRPGALRLERLASQVAPGDPANLEAQAARHYWAQLLPEGQKRQKQGADDPINARLNFGFAVLRSLVARELAAVGLNLHLGLGHHSLENPFNLADDLMEPYRFVVERRAAAMPLADDFTPAERMHLAGLIGEEVELDRGMFRLPAAIQESVASLVRCLGEPSARLRLPVYRCRSTAGA
jgi:CRISPR-associated protein Cas1